MSNPLEKALGAIRDIVGAAAAGAITSAAREVRKKIADADDRVSVVEEVAGKRANLKRRKKKEEIVKAR